MKTVLAALAGFASAMLLFAGGAYSTLLLLTAEPGRPHAANADVADLWTSEPRRIDVSAQRLERAEPLPTARTAAAESADAAGGAGVASASGRTIDPGIAPATAGLAPVNGDRIAAAAAAGREARERDLWMHVAWCSDRYRSYRPEDNTYVSYGGERRICETEYLSGASQAGMTIGASEAVYVEAAASEALPSAIAGDENIAMMDAGHVQSCFARYRSYRPQDNSYQPYGGGPRRQCE